MRSKIATGEESATFPPPGVVALACPEAGRSHVPVPSCSPVITKYFQRLPLGSWMLRGTNAVIWLASRSMVTSVSGVLVVDVAVVPLPVSFTCSPLATALAPVPSPQR